MISARLWLMRSLEYIQPFVDEQRLIQTLCSMYYFRRKFKNAHKLLKFIERHKLYDLEFPFGSFEAFRKHVLLGDLDIDICHKDLDLFLNYAYQRCDELQQDIDSGKCAYIHFSNIEFVNKVLRGWPEYPKQKFVY